MCHTFDFWEKGNEFQILGQGKSKIVVTRLCFQFLLSDCKIKFLWSLWKPIAYFVIFVFEIQSICFWLLLALTQFPWVKNLPDFPSIKLLKRHSRYRKYAAVSIFSAETFENQACGVKFLKHDSKSESISCW